VNSSALFQAFFEESSDALLAVRLKDSSIFRANKTLTALFGVTREEVEGERLTVLQNSVMPAGFERERSLSHEVVENEGYYNDILIVTKAGEPRFASVRVRHLEIDSERYALMVLSDDTERQLMMRDLVAKHQSMEQAYQELERVHFQLKETQEKMSQASKLVALGELAAGMSHELNQPLTGIRGFAQELHDIVTTVKKPKRAELAGLAQDVIQNADKMAELLSHLRDFARKERNHFQTSSDHPHEAVPVATSLANVLKLLHKQFEDRGITVDVSVIPESLAVRAHTHPFEQVLINLLTNSRDAILEKRETQKNLKGHISFEAHLENSQVVMRVRDNGPGVSASIRERIFDPFFSTKSQGKGLGLGLSISFSIVHNFGGELHLEESGPQGSCFVLKLPIAVAKREAKAA
jgi:two-component system C4-dicarboxylate transport sensor histidine kinase DctB